MSLHKLSPANLEIMKVVWDKGDVTINDSAVAEKQKTRREILEDIKNRVFGGSRAELVKCLIEDSDVSPEEIKELRALLKDM